MRWKATVIVRLFQHMSFIWSVNYNNFFHSNMSNFVPEKVFLRGVLLHYFNMKKTAAERHRILVEAYGEHASAKRTCQKWFARFKSGDFGLEDEERPGQQKKFEDEELDALLDEDC